MQDLNKFSKYLKAQAPEIALLQTDEGHPVVQEGPKGGTGAQLLSEAEDVERTALRWSHDCVVIVMDSKRSIAFSIAGVDVRAVEFWIFNAAIRTEISISADTSLGIVARTSKEGAETEGDAGTRLDEWEGCWS